MKRMKFILSVLLSAAILLGMIPVMFVSATGDKPAAPTSVKATASGDREITISWNAVAGATQYNVYRYENNQGQFKYLGTTFATAAKPTQYVNTGLTAGSTFRYYVVSVIKANGTTSVSANSAEASAKALGTPTVPTGVTVKPTAEKELTVTWTAVTGATQYNIYRWNGTDYTYLGTSFATAANPTQYVNTGLTVGNTYSYKVLAACKGSGLTFVGELSVAASAKALGKPAIPAGVTVKATAEKELTVSWTAVAGATQYNVYRWNGKEYTYLGTTFANAANPTQYVNTGLTVGSTYEYKVLAACKGNGLTFVGELSNASSAMVLGTPAVPTGVTVKPTAEKELTVSWAAVKGATQYNVYRWNGTSYTYLGTTFATAAIPTQYVNTGLTVGNTYSYKVLAACKGNGLTFVGALSDAASAMALSTPAVPTGVTVKPTAEKELTVSWAAVKGATQYNVYRWNGTDYTYLGTTFATAANPTQYVNTGLTVGNTYEYKVLAACKGNGLTFVGELSAAASAMAVGTPAVPTGVTVKPTAEKELTVSWAAVKGATQYNVYRWNGTSYTYLGTTFATAANPTQYVNTGLTVGNTYEYKVLAACKGNGLTFVGELSAAASAMAVGTPAVPTGVTVNPTAEKELTVSWAAVKGATQYNVYRWNGTDYTYLGTTFATAANPTQYVNTGLIVGNTYYYKVLAACKGNGLTFVGALSDAASAIALGTPNVPTGVAAAATGLKEITVSWNAVKGATQYNIYRYRSSDNQYGYLGTTFITEAKPTQYVNSGLAVGTTYYYKVVAVLKKDGKTYVSAYSDPAFAKTWDIVQLQEENVTLSGTCFKYDGTVKQPAVTVTINGTVLAKDTDYTLAFSDGCIENGTYTVTVTGIGNYKGSIDSLFVISESGHTPEAIPAKEATCTEDGNEEGSRCAVCGTVLTEPAVIPALGHDIAPVEAKEPTCTKKGNNAYYACTRCGDAFTDDQGTNATTVEAQEIDATGHEYVWVHMPVSCTAPALREKRCDVCDVIFETIEDNSTVPLGHEESVYHAPSCTEGGYDGIDCQRVLQDIAVYDETDTTILYYMDDMVCGYLEKNYRENEPALGHLYDDNSEWTVVTPAECEAAGVKSTTCNRCGETFTAEIPATGHGRIRPYTDPEPTCTTTGLTQYICQVCHRSVRETVEPFSHDFVEDVTIFPSCTEPGLSIFKCENCMMETDQIQEGSLLKTTVAKNGIPAGSYGTVTAIADETYTLDFTIIRLNGQTGDYTAAEFEAPTTYTETTPATGHTVTNFVERQPWTCTQDGIYEYTGECSVCHEVLTGQQITLPMKGHVVAPDAQPTCTSPVICEVCPEIVIAALGHDYVVPGCVLSDQPVNGFYCKRCGELPFTTDGKADALKDLLNTIKSDAYYLSDPTHPKTVTAATKEKMVTSYTKFDFGIYTSVIKNMFESDFSGDVVSYDPVETSTIHNLFPLMFRKIAIKNGFGAEDLDNIRIEIISGFNTNTLFAGFDEAPTKGNAPEIGLYQNRAVNENVIKVTLDIKDDVFSKNTAINNVNSEYRSNNDGSKTYLYDTHISKVFDYDVRRIVDNAGFDENTWKLVEGGDEEGYEMAMELKSIKSDARITYYFAADDYEPIAATYRISEVMNQNITFSMKGLNVNGEIVPVINNERAFVYFFTNYFNN